ncbi:type II secretion system F family protein [Planctomicrobium sp. SH664]|uniref:type II secretion system F family protein n=1 Tax=Planctomicrobium sp. SH664 TaxID=3448125 RepID=UPI003F5C9A18
MMILALTFSPLAISIIAFIGVTGLIASAVLLLENAGSSSVEDRLDILAGKKSAKSEGSMQVTREALVKEGLSGLHGFMNKLVNRFSHFKLLFVQADTPLAPEKFLLISIGTAILAVGIGVAAKCSLPFYPLLALVGGLLPFGWLMFRRGRRFKAFANQLPQAMELTARALRSGHSLASAMRVVVDELPDPISKEFNIAYEEQNLGIPIEQALKNVYYRMPNMDYKFFAMAVAIQRQSGGDLAEILDKIGHIIRERFRIMGQVQALTGEGRISGVVLMLLPIALFVAVWRLNPEYVMMLFTDPLGRQMVAVAIVLQLIGAYAIKKIIAIKV